MILKGNQGKILLAPRMKICIYGRSNKTVTHGGIYMKKKAKHGADYIFFNGVIASV